MFKIKCKVNLIEEEARRRTERVRKALQEGRVDSFRWSNDGSCCDFNYRGMDHHGEECRVLSTLNRANAITAFSGLRLTPTLEKGGAQ